MRKIIFIILIITAILFPKDHNKRMRNIMGSIAIMSFTAGMATHYKMMKSTEYKTYIKYEKLSKFFGGGAVIFICAGIPFDIELDRKNGNKNRKTDI